MGRIEARRHFLRYCRFHPETRIGIRRALLFLERWRKAQGAYHQPHAMEQKQG